jgi:MFS family permease
MALPIARLADRGLARTTIIAISVATWSLMTALSGMAQSYGQLLLARCAVGIGSAGGGPSAHSIISDIFSRAERSRAMAIWALAIPVGAMFGLLLGGWLAESLGWHKALLLVGLPGIPLALLFRATVREPERGLLEGKSVTPEDQMPISLVLRTMLANRTYVQVLTAGMVGSVCSLGISMWFPSFFVRVHGMSLAQVGTGWGLVNGAAGVIGILGGGYLSDRLGLRDPRRIVMVPMVGMLIAVPFYWASVTVEGGAWSLALLFVPIVVNNSWIAVATALGQSLVPPSMRAMSSASIALVHNIVAGALAPLLLGAVSDLLTARIGSPAEGLRWTLILLGALYFWAAAHFWAASRSIARDLA